MKRPRRREILFVDELGDHGLKEFERFCRLKDAWREVYGSKGSLWAENDRMKEAGATFYEGYTMKEAAALTAERGGDPSLLRKVKGGFLYAKPKTRAERLGMSAEDIAAAEAFGVDVEKSGDFYPGDTLEDIRRMCGESEEGRPGGRWDWEKVKGRYLQTPGGVVEKWEE